MYPQQSKRKYVYISLPNILGFQRPSGRTSRVFGFFGNTSEEFRAMTEGCNATVLRNDYWSLMAQDKHYYPVS